MNELDKKVDEVKADGWRVIRYGTYGCHKIKCCWLQKNRKKIQINENGNISLLLTISFKNQKP